MPRLTRRATLGLLPLALLPTALRAETCAEALPGLRLCDVWGWARETAADGVITLTHATGLTGVIRFETGLDAEGETWARWEHGQAPMRARALILDTWFSEVEGRLFVGSAWRPRHETPLIVAMSSFVGEGLSLDVTTTAATVEFEETHREVHEQLCAAIRLDLPE